MRGVVKIDDGSAVHVIPRAEVRHVEVTLRGADSWGLRYQLTGAAPGIIVWEGECRPASLRSKIDAGEYNRLAARNLLIMITCGYRDLHLERRSDNVFLVRSGLIEDDVRSALCRKFIAEAAAISIQAACGPFDDPRRQLIREIQSAARDLVLPDWYPLKEEA